MKNFLILFVVLGNGVLFGCGIKSIKNDLEKENLKGNILSVRTTNYKVSEKFGEPVKGEIDCYELDICDNITKYNTFGNQIEFSEYDSFGISFITKIKYNDKNQKIEQNRYTPIEGKRVMQFVSKYDEKGNCIEVSSDSGYLEKREYYENGDISKMLVKDWRTGNFNETIYLYDENNKIKTESYSQGRTEYTYYANGDTKDVIYFNEKEIILGKGSYIYKYDKNKNWIAQIAYQDGVPTSYIERIIEYKN